MGPDLKDTYARQALDQIPRLLGNQDRNPYSPTYGCFHRDYWLDKTSDFPDAVRQFGVHSLALIYKHDFPGNPYRGQSKIREWTTAGLDYWAKIQHRDGSFDEFYPYERGWVGPTAFTTFTAIEALNLLGDEIPPAIAERVCSAIQRAAYFITAGQKEEDHLANHHAMACLAVWKAYRLLDDPALKEGYERLWTGFLGYHNPDEGWSIEYDGVDPGYLSAVVSFLGKIYQDNPDPGIYEVLRQSVEFCAYFVYPDDFYAGSLGSRNTLHFYPHGFEIMSNKLPMAATIAETMLRSLEDGNLVPPRIMSDRYVYYRVSEFLQSYLDYNPRQSELPPLPYQSDSLSEYFPKSRIHARSTGQHYTIANLAKGGVFKVFNRQDGRLLLNNCGLIGKLDDGRVVTTQWIDPEYECQADAQGWTVSGNMHVVPSNKLFTPTKHILFRIVLLLFGWNPAFSHLIKGRIRKILMLGQRPVPVRFKRSLRIDSQTISLIDNIYLNGDVSFASLSSAGEFFVRYVPQSRYFQINELAVSGKEIYPQELEVLNDQRHLTLKSEVRA